MRSIKLPILMTLLGACSLINDPADHQAGGADAAADVGADGSPIDTSTRDGGGADTGVDARPMDDTGPIDDAGPMDDAEPIDDAGPMDDAEPMDDAGPMEDAGPDTGPPTVTSAEYCTRFAELLCAANVSCCDDRDAPFTDCEIVIRQECAELHGPTPRLPSFLTFDGVRAAEVLESLQPLTEGCDTDVVLWSINDFMSPLIGARTSFEACTPAALMPREIIHAVVSCDRSGDGLENAACQPTMGVSWQCELRRSPGNPCYLGPQCLSNRCEPNLLLPTLLAGTCGNGLANGEVCQAERPDQCASLVCEDTGPDWRCTERTSERVYCRTN